MLPLLKYSVLRLALFVLALGLLSLLGAGRVAAVIGAALISMMLSYVLLRGPREALSQQISDRAHHRIVAVQERVAGPGLRDAAIEDAADEARRGTES